MNIMNGTKLVFPRDNKLFSEAAIEPIHFFSEDSVYQKTQQKVCKHATTKVLQL